MIKCAAVDTGADAGIGRSAGVGAGMNAAVTDSRGGERTIAAPSFQNTRSASGMRMH
jgi:hypothetical protein